MTYFAVTPCNRRRRSVVRGAISGRLASDRGLTALRCCCGCLDRLRLRVGSLCDADHDQRRTEGKKAKSIPAGLRETGQSCQRRFPALFPEVTRQRTRPDCSPRPRPSGLASKAFLQLVLLAGERSASARQSRTSCSEGDPLRTDELLPSDETCLPSVFELPEVLCRLLASFEPLGLQGPCRGLFASLVLSIL